MGALRKRYFLNAKRTRAGCACFVCSRQAEIDATLRATLRGPRNILAARAGLLESCCSLGLREPVDRRVAFLQHLAVEYRPLEALVP